MVSRIAWAAAGFILFVAPVSGGPLQEAITSRDLLKLEKLSGGASTAEEGHLAAGAALSLRHKDDAALALLEPLARKDGPARGDACLALADIYLRQSRYADLRAALECAAPLNAENSQVLDYARVLAAEKPMQLTKPASGKIGVRRDRAGLIRAQVEINGERKSAVIDTDASFCVLAESEAERLGVRVLDKRVTIITATRSDQPMRLGVADQLKFGDAVLSNVVFAVLPDSAVRFGPDYRMEAVIGLSVFVALGRIELAEEEGNEVLYYGRSAVSPVAEPNMALSGLDPFALLREVRTGVMLRLAIDSAAQKTTLNGTALREYPVLADGASRSWARWQGAGGDQLDAHARTIPEFRLMLDGRPIGLTRVKILSADERDRHGAIGQDFLKQGARWILDFEAMHFAVAD